MNRYLPKKYGMSGGRLNTFAFFLERARNLCRVGGLFSYILPNTFTTQEYYEPLRRNLLHESTLMQMTVPEGDVFHDAVIENAIVVAAKKKLSTIVSKNLVQFELLKDDGTVTRLSTARQADLAMTHRMSFVSQTNAGIAALQAKLLEESTKLGQIAHLNQGIALKKDRAACLVQSKKSSLYNEILDGRNIGRYVTGVSPNFFRFDVAKIHSCKREDIFIQNEKILFRRVGDRLTATLDTKRKYALNTLVVLSLRPEYSYDLRFILGCFNSRVMNFYYSRFLKSTKKVFSEIQARQVAQLPIPNLNLKIGDDLVIYRDIVSSVNKMILAKEQSSLEWTEQDHFLAEAKCIALDRHIDQLVYKAFRLTAKEIAVIEQTG